MTVTYYKYLIVKENIPNLRFISHGAIMFSFVACFVFKVCRILSSAKFCNN